MFSLFPSHSYSHTHTHTKMHACIHTSFAQEGILQFYESLLPAKSYQMLKKISVQHSSNVTTFFTSNWNSQHLVERYSCFQEESNDSEGVRSCWEMGSKLLHLLSGAAPSLHSLLTDGESGSLPSVQHCSCCCSMCGQTGALGTGDEPSVLSAWALVHVML